jgi:MoaA/NifB/PqqE/SkfB family radical SAM enzyme
MKEVKRKKKKPLNNQHWMARVQKFAFGIDCEKKYTGYCPFFWATWSAILLLPFILIGRGVFAVLEFVWKNTFTKFIEPKIEARRKRKDEADNSPLKPDDKDLIKIAKFVKENQFKESNIFEYFYFVYSYTQATRILNWFKENTNWLENELPSAKERYESLLAQLEEQRKQDSAREKKIEEIKEKISNFCKIFVKPAIFVACVGAAFLIYKGIFWLYFNLQWKVIAQMVFDFVWNYSLYAVGAVVGIILLKKLLGEYGEKYIAFPIFRVFEICGEAYSFLKQTIVMTYKKECPLIIWGEETGPIQKNDDEK